MKTLALISVAAGFAAAAATAAGTSTPTYGNCGKQVRRPAAIVVTCADANYQLRGLKWSSWGGPTAKATGKAFVNDCKPYCAAGHVHSYAARVTLSKVKLCSRGVRSYTVLTVTYSAKGPAGSKQTEAFTSACSGY